MCGFTFTVFLSAFQLLPTAPFHILALGGSTLASGLFLGFLTYSSAFSAPLTGALADRLGTRRILIISSLALAGFSLAYAVIPGYRVMLALVLVHGVFWSGLLSASAAYMTSMLPERRRAEGIGYWGLSSIAAIAVAPPIGFWIFQFGWSALCIVAAVLNLLMAAIAWHLPPHVGHASRAASTPTAASSSGACCCCRSRCSSTRSATAASRASPRCTPTPIGVTPKGLYLTALAIVILLTRPLSGRLGDRFGYRRVFLPCLVADRAGSGAARARQLADVAG